MPDYDPRYRHRLQRIMIVLSTLMVLSFALAGWSFYQGHRTNCEARNTALDVLRDVIVIASTPQKGDHVTAAQQKRIDGFRKATFARINQARC